MFVTKRPQKHLGGDGRHRLVDAHQFKILWGLGRLPAYLFFFRLRWAADCCSVPMRGGIEGLGFMHARNIQLKAAGKHG